MKKRILSVLLALTLCLGLAPAAFAAGGTAYASTQTVLVDGAAVVFQAYALKDPNGNDTNYVKLRDVASVLNGTSVQFNVGWNGSVNIEKGQAYVPNGSEMSTPFSGDRAYEPAAAGTNIDGQPAGLEAIVLKDDDGGAYTYYKLRDLGAALGFVVDWSAETGIFIETGGSAQPQQPEQPKTISATPLYEDSKVKINFVRIEKGKYDADRAELYLDVDNKTSGKITVQCDAVSLNGYCFNNVTMSDDVSADSIGTVNASIEGFDFSLVSLDKVETVGGQFRIITDGFSNSYDALFPARNIYTAQTDNTIPSAGDRAALYSDSKVEIYFDHAEPYKYSDDGSRIEIYLMVRNKTSKTLLIQNDTVKVDRRSFENTTMSDPVLPNSAGYVNVSVRDYTGPAASTVTTIGGDFRVIDDAGRDRYDITLGSISDLGSDGGKGATPPATTTDPGTGSGDVTTGEVNDDPVPTTSITGGRAQLDSDGKMLLNYAPGVEEPDATYPNFPEVPDFGRINGIRYDPKYSWSKEDEEGRPDDSYYYYFNLSLEGYNAVELAELRNAYLRKLSGLGFSNPMGTSLGSESANDMMVKNTDNGKIAVHVMVAADPGIDFGFIYIGVDYF